MLSWSTDRPIWLLDYDVGGHVLRYATEGTTVTDNAGDTYLYNAGLSDVQTDALFDLGRRTQSLEIISDEDWALFPARAISLDERAATLRLSFGEALELVRDVATGRTENVAHREQGEPFRMDVVTDSEKSATWLPSAQAQTSDETWPVRANYSLTKGGDGIPYPIPIGYPGDHPKISPGVSLGEPTSPAPWVEQRTTGSPNNERWLVALGDIDAAQVTLWYLDSDDYESTDLSTATMLDGLGQRVTYVETSSLANEDATFWVGFRKETGWGGGIKSPYTGNVLRNAHEVVRYMLDYFGGGIEIDEARFVGDDGWLSRFQIDGVLAERTNPVSWLNDEILSLLPVIGVQGERGYYLAPMRWDATERDAVAYLSVDRGQLALDGDLITWSEPLWNQLTLEYRYTRALSRSMSRRTLTTIEGNLYAGLTAGANLPPFSTSLPWIATTENDARIWGSSLCGWSQAKYGVHENGWVTEFCWDDATAALILQYKALKHAWRKRMGRFVGGMELRHLSPGDVVVLDYAAMHLSSVVCLVSNSIISATEVALDLILLEHPLQNTRATS